MDEQAYRDLLLLAKESQWQYEIDKMTATSLKSLLLSIDQAKQELRAYLNTRTKPFDYSEERAVQLLAELEFLTVGVRDQLKQDIADIASDIGTMAYEQYNEMLSFGGAVKNFSAVAMSASQVRAMVLTSKIGGRHLSEWVDRTFSGELQDKIKREIQSGMLQGEGFRPLINRIERGFNVTKRQAETLTKSYVQTVSAQASLDVAMANHDIIKGWRWSSVNENGYYYTSTGKGHGRGICMMCLALASKDTIYPLDGGPPLPKHPNCRCTRLYITKSFKELGLDIDEIPDYYVPYSVRGLINKKTGEITPKLIGKGGRKMIDAGTFKGGYESFFFDKLTQQMQKQTIGPKRWAMWDRGDFGLDDLVDRKGDLRTIKTLQRMFGR